MADERRFVIVKKEWIEDLSRLLKDDGEKLLERFRYRLHEQKNKILEQAFSKKIITNEEYQNNYKDRFYDEFGFDGFLQYLDAAMNAKSDYFVTLNKNLIKRRKEVEDKFKLRIISVDELKRIADKKQKQ